MVLFYRSFWIILKCSPRSHFICMIIVTTMNCFWTLGRKLTQSGNNELLECQLCSKLSHVCVWVSNWHFGYTRYSTEIIPRERSRAPSDKVQIYSTLFSSTDDWDGFSQKSGAGNKTVVDMPDLVDASYRMVQY